MSGSVRYAVPIVAVLCLGSLAAQSSVGQAPKDAESSTPAPAEISQATGGFPPTGYYPERARALYIANCSACHGADGEGRPGMYPPIKGSGVVNKDDATKHILVVLNGLQGAKAEGVLYATPMPPFGNLLSDADIADIIDYQRSAWGNHGKHVTAAQVAAQRARSK
jgi:mono/diheme cytochrome c family protein